MTSSNPLVISLIMQLSLACYKLLTACSKLICYFLLPEAGKKHQIVSHTFLGLFKEQVGVGLQTHFVVVSVIA